MSRALVFDFDGLILDTEGPEFQAWQEIYAAHGCHLTLESWAACIGTRDAFDPYADLPPGPAAPSRRRRFGPRKRRGSPS